MIAIFMYVGGEVTIGSLLVNFFGLPEIAGLGEIEASAFLSFYWGGTMIGRFLGAISLSSIASNKKFGLMTITAIATFFVIYGIVYLNTGISLKEISPFLIFVGLNLLAFRLGNSNPQRTLAIFSGIVMILLTVVILTSGKVAFWSVIAIGLFNSIMWSNVFTLAISGLGKYTELCSGGLFVPLGQAQGGTIIKDIFNDGAAVASIVHISDPYATPGDPTVPKILRPLPAEFPFEMAQGEMLYFLGGAENKKVGVLACLRGGAIR